MYLTFPPVNEQAVSEASLAAANDFYSYAEEASRRRGRSAQSL